MSHMSLQGDGEPLKILSGVGNVQWFLQEERDGPQPEVLETRSAFKFPREYCKAVLGRRDMDLPFFYTPHFHRTLVRFFIISYS